MLKSLIKKLIFSILKPERRIGGTNTLKELLKLPVIFDLTSFFIQLRFLNKIININNIEKESDYIEDVKNYNYSVTSNKLITRNRRAEIYYKLSSLILPNLSNKKLLIIGPRNVQELYMAWIYGFSWKNITGVDLYSAHQKIKVMDMHNLEFKDETFDCVIMSHTLAYAQDTEKVIDDVCRILKPSGTFSFGATYDPGDKRFAGSIINGETIYKILKKDGMKIIFHFPVEKINMSKRNQTLHHISAQKMDLNSQFTDSFNL